MWQCGELDEQTLIEIAPMARVTRLFGQKAVSHKCNSYLICSIM